LQHSELCVHDAKGALHAAHEPPSHTPEQQPVPDEHDSDSAAHGTHSPSLPHVPSAQSSLDAHSAFIAERHAQLSHTPPQHCMPLVHDWFEPEGMHEQIPFSHIPEQQSEPVEQGRFCVLQAQPSDRHWHAPW